MKNAHNLGKSRRGTSSFTKKLLFFWAMLAGTFCMREKSPIGPAAASILSGAGWKARRPLADMRLKQHNQSLGQEPDFNAWESLFGGSEGVEFSDVWRRAK